MFTKQKSKSFQTLYEITVGSAVREHQDVAFKIDQTCHEM